MRVGQYLSMLRSRPAHPALSDARLALRLAGQALGQRARSAPPAQATRLLSFLQSAEIDPTKRTVTLSLSMRFLIEDLDRQKVLRLPATSGDDLERADDMAACLTLAGEAAAGAAVKGVIDRLYQRADVLRSRRDAGRDARVEVTQSAIKITLSQSAAERLNLYFAEAAG